MNSSGSEFDRLLDRHLDGELSAEEGARFVRLLVADPENVRVLARASVLHQQVRSTFKLDRVAISLADRKGSEVRRRLLSWACLAGGVLLAITSAFAIWRLSREDRVAPWVAAPASTSPLEVSSVHIVTGTTKLILPSIGYVIVEGPAEFDLLAPLRARLAKGRIRVHVTEKTGHGFVVETPHGNVTDLGTEFGLDVSSSGDDRTSLVVFDGTVDLERSADAEAPTNASRIDRLVRGEGVTFHTGGELNRIMSIVTGRVATFEPGNEARNDGTSSVILDVSDNIRDSRFKKFYEVVPGGLREDALAFVEWPEHDWNGVDEQGMPPYLIGADYVKPFDTDKLRDDLEISVTLASPARLFVFFDQRVSPPEWLKSRFRDTGDVIGLDAGPFVRDGKQFYFGHDVGPGKSIDAVFCVWEQMILKPGVVRIGPNSATSDYSSMYGIAAVEFDNSR